MARRKGPTGLRRAWGVALWALGAVVMLGGMAQLALLILSQERIVTQALRAPGPEAPAVLEEVVLPEDTVATAVAAAYPDKARNSASPWGCAAFDLDAATPPPAAATAVTVSLSPRPARRDLVGYRLVAGEATDTLIPDLGFFASCLETGTPEQVIETPARRSSPAFPASRWSMDALDIDAAVTVADAIARPTALRIEFARSAPDVSPYIEALPVAEPFGAVWLLDHGSQSAPELRVMGRLAPARCEFSAGPGGAPRFERFAFDAQGVGAGEPAPLTDPRRRLFDLASGLAGIPEAAAMAAWRTCEGPDCETREAFMERHQTIAAAQWCDAAGGAVWRLRLDARLTAPNAADPARPFVSVVSALVPLEPPGPLTAAPVYQTPAPGAVGLRSQAGPYAIAAALGPEEGEGVYSVRLRLAAPTTSTHLFRVVAVDETGAALGASRWTHLLAFVPEAAAPAPVAAAPAAAPAPPITPAAVTARGAFAAADSDAEAPLPNP